MNLMKPNELKLGDIFYECECGINMELEVIEAPVAEEIQILDTPHLQWSWKAKRKDGEIIKFTVTEGYGAYGPKIYKSPQYMKRVKNELIYEII